MIGLKKRDMKKILKAGAKKTGVDYLKEIRKHTKLTEKHEQIIAQQTASIEEVIVK